MVPAESAGFRMGPTSTPAKPRVLVVDDDADILDFLALALEDEGFEVRTAHNGAAALEQLRDDHGSAPEVIILDLWMPVMDGWTFLKEYRERPGPHAAVIALTAAQYDPERSAEVDAEGFLRKPFSLDDLLELVGRFVVVPAEVPGDAAQGPALGASSRSAGALHPPRTP